MAMNKSPEERHALTFTKEYCMKNDLSTCCMFLWCLKKHCLHATKWWPTKCKTEYSHMKIHKDWFSYYIVQVRFTFTKAIPVNKITKKCITDLVPQTFQVRCTCAKTTAVNRIQWVEWDSMPCRMKRIWWAYDGYS